MLLNVVSEMEIVPTRSSVVHQLLGVLFVIPRERKRDRN